MMVVCGSAVGGIGFWWLRNLRGFGDGWWGDVSGFQPFAF